MNIDVNVESSNKKIDTILTDILGLTIAEANELASKLELTLGIKKRYGNDDNDGDTNSNTNKEASNKKKRFKIMISAGKTAKKIDGIKEARAINKTLAIKEAKDLVENGGMLLDDIDEQKCEECKKSLSNLAYEIVEI